MEYLQGSLLGLVEGLTEFIPVSSTGHLIVVGRLLGFEGRVASTFDVFIQLGAILAVAMLYRGRLGNILSLKKNQGFAGSRGVMLLLLTTIPAGIAGFLARDIIIERLFNPTSVSIGLGLGGIGILVTERFLPKVKKSHVDLLDWKDALIVGIFQVFSLWPGVSRSASTIIGGMYAGIERKTAAEYSFLVAVPMMLSAALFDLYKSMQFLSSSDLMIFPVGFVLAFISAWLSVKFFVRFLSNHTMESFGWYRIVISALIFLIIK